MTTRRVRSLAFKWQRVILKCWPSRTPYREDIYEAALRKSDSPRAALLDQIQLGQSPGKTISTNLTGELSHAGQRCSIDNRDDCPGRPPAGLFGVSGSFGFGWPDILLLSFNLPEFVASPSGVKAFRRLLGIVTDRGQGQCPVLNLEEGSDNFADTFSL